MHAGDVDEHTSILVIAPEQRVAVIILLANRDVELITRIALHALEQVAQAHSTQGA